MKDDLSIDRCIFLCQLACYTILFDFVGRCVRLSQREPRTNMFVDHLFFSYCMQNAMKLDGVNKFDFDLELDSILVAS